MEEVPIPAVPVPEVKTDGLSAGLVAGIVVVSILGFLVFILIVVVLVIFTCGAGCLGNTVVGGYLVRKRT